MLKKLATILMAAAFSFAAYAPSASACPGKDKSRTADEEKKDDDKKVADKDKKDGDKDKADKDEDKKKDKDGKKVAEK